MNNLRAEYRAQLFDSLFLVFIVFISALPYVFALGFYSDDWAYESTLSQHQAQSAWAMFRSLISSDPTMLVRPVQAACLVSEFKAFGLNPVPYHVLGTLLLALAAAVLYLMLSEWGMQRQAALATSLIYALLPLYSTDRFWIASQQAILCVLFGFIGIFAISRLTRSRQHEIWAWGLAALFAFVFSFLSYEVAVGLVVAALAGVSVQLARRKTASAAGNPAAKWWIGGIACCVFAVGAAKTAFQNRFVYHHHLWRFLGTLGEIAKRQAVQAFDFSLWSYGFHLPWVIVRLGRESALSAVAIAAALLIGGSVAAFLWAGCKGELWTSGSCLKLIAAGLAVYALGIFLFASQLDTDFSLPSSKNRIAIASTLGSALLWIGLIGFVCRLVRHKPARRGIFAILVGLICGANSLAMSGIASFWTDSARRQDTIIKSLRKNVPHLPEESVLMLDGFCRYDGPAPVFETDWDTTGALQLAYHDFGLVGDVVSKNAQFTNAAVSTTILGALESHYPYSKNLLVYNLKNRSLHNLDSYAAALRYLQEEGSTMSYDCPDAREGYGTRIF